MLAANAMLCKFCRFSCFFMLSVSSSQSCGEDGSAIRDEIDCLCYVNFTIERRGILGYNLSSLSATLYNVMKCFDN